MLKVLTFTRLLPSVLDDGKVTGGGTEKSVPVPVPGSVSQQDTDAMAIPSTLCGPSFC